MYSRVDIAVGGVLSLLSVGMLAAALRLQSGYDPLGPRFLPALIGSALLGLSLLLVLMVRRAGRQGEAAYSEVVDRAGLGKVTAAVAVMAAFALAVSFLPGLGFPLLAALAVLILCLLYGGRFGVGLIVFSAALAVGVYLLFKVYFKLPLPAPTWL